MTFEKIHASEREMIELVLTRQTYTPEMLCDLVSKLHVLVLNDQERVWKIIEDKRIRHKDRTEAGWFVVDAP